MTKKIYLSVFMLLISFAVLAREGNQATEMADLMRSNGKIYVVTGVILTILAGLIFFLVRIDRKMTRLEQEDLKAKN